MVRILDLTNLSPFSILCLTNEFHSQADLANLIKTCKAHRGNSQSSRRPPTRGVFDADDRRLSRRNSTFLWKKKQ